MYTTTTSLEQLVQRWFSLSCVLIVPVVVIVRPSGIAVCVLFFVFVLLVCDIVCTKVLLARSAPGEPEGPMPEIPLDFAAAIRNSCDPFVVAGGYHGDECFCGSGFAFGEEAIRLPCLHSYHFRCQHIAARGHGRRGTPVRGGS